MHYQANKHYMFMETNTKRWSAAYQRSEAVADKGLDLTLVWGVSSAQRQRGEKDRENKGSLIVGYL